MIIVADSMPGLKRLFKHSRLSEARQGLVLRMVTAFLLHIGRMSCLQAAGAVRSDARHRSQLGRMLQRCGSQMADLNRTLRQLLLAREAVRRGLFLFLIDGTLCSQSGRHTTNTYSTGNRQRRPRKGRRYGKRKHHRKACHSFTMGLLITPSGIRIPFSQPYYTREYCQQKGRRHRTTAETAADLIGALPLPSGVRVVVLADTAYDAQVLRSACAERGYSWIVPSNPGRVLAGPKPRPAVRSLLQDWSQKSLQTIRLFPGRGPYVEYRRLSPQRSGPKAKPRTYYARQEKHVVHSVGEVRLVFSTTQAKLAKATPDDVKILMTNDLGLSVREVVELYSLRWQIELFFKELKSTLGFHQYRFREFERVQAWSELALTTFLYLEHYRLDQLQRRNMSDREQQWWRHQRTYGLRQAVRLAIQQRELHYLTHRLETQGGIRKLKQLLAASFPAEYRAAG